MVPTTVILRSVATKDLRLFSLPHPLSHMVSNRLHKQHRTYQHESDIYVFEKRVTGETVVESAPQQHGGQHHR
jgi:hypothetical protein